MGAGIFPAFPGVVTPGDNFPVLDDDGPNGNLVLATGCFCLLESGAHKGFMGIHTLSSRESWRL